jgi:hypothetical protein
MRQAFDKLAPRRLHAFAGVDPSLERRQGKLDQDGNGCDAADLDDCTA